MELNIATPWELVKIHLIALISDRRSCWDVDFVWNVVDKMDKIPRPSTNSSSNQGGGTYMYIY